MVESALQEGWQDVGIDQVRQVFERQPPVEADEADEEEVLKPADVNLQTEEDHQ